MLGPLSPCLCVGLSLLYLVTLKYSLFNIFARSLFILHFFPRPLSRSRFSLRFLPRPRGRKANGSASFSVFVKSFNTNKVLNCTFSHKLRSIVALVSPCWPRAHFVLLSFTLFSVFSLASLLFPVVTDRPFNWLRMRRNTWRFRSGRARK